MNPENITNLKDIIELKLSPMINDEYIFLDLPYYKNIGDALIWKGTEEFLKKIPQKCLYKSSSENYIKPPLSKNTIILLQGGGNFGDIWRKHTDFLLNIVNKFPENKIIIFPKTAFYKNSNNLKKDAQMMANHSNLIICARDIKTYQLFTKYFYKNKILLVPDMTFFIPKHIFKKNKVKKQRKNLFLKRKDKELLNFNYEDYLDNKKNIEEYDWPSIENKLVIDMILSCLKKIFSLTKNFKTINIIISKIINWYAIKIYMPKLIKIGNIFLNKYQKIYTTRLHGAILGYLLQKEILLFDNSYGKNSSFYETWLETIDSITFIKK